MFNIEELTLIKMYGGMTPDRDSVLAALDEVLPLIEDAEIQEMVGSTIRKVNALTLEAFGRLDLSAALEVDDAEAG
jgi:hypothetical protein